MAYTHWLGVTARNGYAGDVGIPGHSPSEPTPFVVGTADAQTNDIFGFTADPVLISVSTYNDPVGMFAGMGVGVPPLAEPQEVGVLLQSSQPNNFLEPFFAFPAQAGDSIWVTSQTFNGYDLAYTFDVIVGSDINTGERYRCSATDRNTEPQSFRVERLAGSRGANASFTFTPNNAALNEQVTFTNTSTGATSSSWDFGDGRTSTATSPTHNFYEAGEYTVTLTVSGAGGTTSVFSAVVTVPGVAANTGTVWLPVEALNDAQWSSISVKGTPAVFPLKFYDTGDYPLRTIKVWPVPTGDNVALELWLWEPLSNFSLDDELTFPPGYERALRFALAAELAAEFGKELSPQIEAIAKQAKAVIKRLNSQMQVMVGDRAIAANGKSQFSYLIGDTT